MDTISETTFHPYKLISYGRSSLQLGAANNQKALVWILRGMPLFTFATGVVLYYFTREIFTFLMLVGIAFLEAVVLAFVKSPGSISMDSIGFSLDIISIKGINQKYYLWNDVDYMHYQTIKAKQSTTLAYDAILKDNKKVRFLSFPNHHDKLHNLPKINSIISGISDKQVQQK